MSEEAEPDRVDSLSNGDSLAMAGLLVAVVAFILTPPVWLKAILLLLVVSGVGVCIRISDWTRAWTDARRLVVFTSVSSLLLILGIQQIHMQLRAENMPSFAAIAGCVIQGTVRILDLPWPQRFLWFSIGGAAVLCTQTARKRRAEIDTRNNCKRRSEKGFLDYKLQTEKAISSLGPALSDITRITTGVGELVERLAQRTHSKSINSTAGHLRIVRRAAGKLEVLSHLLDSTCLRLEEIGTDLEEGMVGWFNWGSRQINARAELLAAEPSIAALCCSIATGVSRTDEYIRILISAKGISLDMNVALDAQIAAISRVRNANTTILSACSKTLELISDCQH